MTTSITAIFDGKVLIPSGQVDIPQGTTLRIHVELESSSENSMESLSKLPACGLWADRTDLNDTSSTARQLRHRVETREDHGR